MLGFELNPTAIRQYCKRETGSNFVRIGELSSSLDCTIVIENHLYEETFKDVSDILFLEEPITIKENVTFSIELNFSWLFDYGDALSKYTAMRFQKGYTIGDKITSGLMVCKTNLETTINGEFGIISFKSGDCFVKRFYVKNLSNRVMARNN